MSDFANFYRGDSQARKFLALFGGFVIHLVIGTIYITGNITIYMASYLQHEGHSVSLNDLTIILPLQTVGSTLTQIVGAYLAQKYSIWVPIIMGNSIIVFSVFVTSFLQSYALILIVYGFIFGIGVGLSYTPPLIMSWSHFPSYKGRVSGIIVGGFGLGASIFNIVSTDMINPNNEKPHDKYNGVKYFSSDVAYRYPATMRWLAFIYLILTVVGLLLLMKPNRVPVIEETTSEECPSIKKAVSSKNFWILFFMFLVSIIPGYFIVNTFKVYGKTVINDDEFLSIVGSVGSFVNGGSRFLWGQLYDKIQFKLTYSIILISQALLMTSLIFVAKVKALYLIWISLMLGCEGGHFAIIPPTVAKMYGREIGSKMLAMIFYSLACSAMLNYVLYLVLVNYIGYEGLFFTLGLVPLLNFIGLFFFSDANEWALKSSINNGEASLAIYKKHK